MNLCIYHGGCTDGVAAAWAFSQHATQPQVFFPGMYQADPPWEAIEAAHRVYLVDFSYKRPVMEELARRAQRPPVVLDHHDTAQDQLEPLLENGTLEGRFDMGQCGALITWQWFTDRPPPALLAHIDLADRRAEGYSDHTKGLMLAVRTRPHAPEAPTDAGFEALFRRWSWLMQPSSFLQLEQEGAALLPYYHQRVAEHVAHASEWQLGDYLVPTVNAPYYLASDVAGELAITSRDGIGAVYWVNADGSVTFSLRSCERRGESTPDNFHGSDEIFPAPHVGRFAEAFAGGGGHPRAAGFKLPLFRVDPVGRVVLPPDHDLGPTP